MRPAAAPASPASPRPRICVIGYKSLSRLVYSVAADYQGRADIEVIDEVFDRSVEAARSRERDGRSDVFVSAGANAVILRNALRSPVATIKVGGFDIWQALLKAQALSDRVAIVTYRDTSAEIEMGKGLLKVEVAQRSYRTADEARECVAALAVEGHSVVVGSSLVIDLAEQHGMTGILAYSASAVHQALTDAIDMARARRLEVERFARRDAVLQHLHEAVIAVDQEDRITAINPAMEALLGVQSAQLIGRPLPELSPDLGLGSVIRSGQPELAAVMTIGGRMVVGNRMPIREAGGVTGALLTLQDAGLIQRADGQLRSQNRPRQLTARYRFSHLLGRSPAFVQACGTARRYATSSSTVLIIGESGTGKELMAQAIHNESDRGSGPFVAVNCAAFPEPLLESELFGYEEGAFTGSRRGGKPGLFEVAHTGSIFLDEIGDMPLMLQSRLLRVLQEKEVVRLGGLRPVPIDVRIIAATHQPLQQRVEEGRFREDLYYRLNILQLRLPPLRERAEDIPVLALQMIYVALRRAGSNLPADLALAPLMPMLRRHRWPGNVRELENVAERLAVYLAQFSSLDEDVYEGVKNDFPELYEAPRALIANQAQVRPWSLQPEPQALQPPQPTPPIQPLEPPQAAAAGPSPQPDPSAPAPTKLIPERISARPRATASDEDILGALASGAQSRDEAAALLGMSRTTLWRRLRDIEARRSAALAPRA